MNYPKKRPDHGQLKNLKFRFKQKTKKIKTKKIKKKYNNNSNSTILKIVNKISAIKKIIKKEI